MIKNLEIKTDPWLLPAKRRGIYLSIGLNYIDPDHYGSDGRLEACNKDAKDIADLAISQGFKPYSGGALLLNENATRERVKYSISEIAKYLQPGDFFLLNYSGHGGTIKDSSGDEEDKVDETWCLYDGQLIDDELGLLMAKFKEGVRVLVLSDSCHSGTVSKVLMISAAYSVAEGGIETPTLSKYIPKVKTLSELTLSKTYENNKSYYDNVIHKIKIDNPTGDNIDTKASILLVSGCQDNQLSLDGKNNGLFTWTLKDVWNNSKSNDTYVNLHKEIVKRMPPYQTPNLYWYGKNTFVEAKPFKI